MDMADSPVSIQATAESVPSTPSWFGEVAVVAHTLRRLDALSVIEERVRFARRRFGHYDLIDFVVVLLGYALSGERTLEAFYESVQPFATLTLWSCCWVMLLVENVRWKHSMRASSLSQPHS